MTDTSREANDKALRSGNGIVAETPLRTLKVFVTDADLWTVYQTILAFRGKLVGGVPREPKLVEGWLRARAGIDDRQELRLAVLRTLAELGDNAHDDSESPEDGLAAAAQKRCNGFKIANDGLYVEGRQVKAMLKESTNIVFAGERWGPTRKSAKSFVAERVFVDPDRIPLGVKEPSGVETVLDHLSGPSGPRSALSSYEYVEQPLINFRVRVLRDCITANQWRDIWSHAQENGFGTLRSQGYGRFDVVQWERIATNSD